MDILPVSTQSAVQTIFVTSTGIEKIFTIIGIVTVVTLALLGLITIIVKVAKNGLQKRVKA